MYSFQIGKVYSFDTIAPAHLGETFKNVKITGLLDYNNAIKRSNIDVLQSAIRPYLPSGTPNDPRDYTYLLFETETGNTIAMAYPWIREATIQETINQVVTASIFGASANDAQKIKAILALAGYNNVTLQIANIGSSS